MKIMITLSCLQGGGAERVAVVWADAFVRLGHDVVLATNKGEFDKPYVYPINPKVKVVKCFVYKEGKAKEHDAKMRRRLGFPYRVYSALTYYVKTNFALRREIRCFRPDVVLGVLQPTSLQALVASIGLPCNVVATEHNSFERPLSAPLSKRASFFKFTANKWFPLVSVLTTADKTFIGNRLNNIEVMSNPLALAPLAAPLSDKKKRIVAAGRLSAWHCKGFDVLIKAWGKIAHKHPEWLLDIAGTGDEVSKAYLQSLINDNAIASQAVLSGFHDDMATFYAESEIFVLSSRYEGFGMVLIEAMSQGCACVAADYKGRQEEIFGNGGAGKCVEPENVEAMANALEELIDNETERKELQRKAIKRSHDFDAVEIARKWETLLIENFSEK